MLFACVTSVRRALSAVLRPVQGLLLATAVVAAGCGGGTSAPTTPTTPQASAPVFSPAGGSFATTQSVTLSDSTTGATIYYTVDGSTPTSASTAYSGAISVSKTTTVNAIAVASGYTNSSVATATYSILTATPTFTPAAGTYTAPQLVSIADGTAGAVIHYTVDGTTPTASSPTYTAPIAVATTQTVQAIAIATGLSPSSVASAVYTINLPAAATPVFTPAAGTYTATQTVAITDATPGATILYSTNGSTPSTVYSGPITVSATETLMAFATASGYNQSATASAAYTINLPPAATPTFSPAAGTYTSTQTVSILDATTGAQIHYTTNGTAPTASSALYTGPITVSATETLMAIATATNYTTSAVGSAAYTINLPAAPTPTFSPAAGTYTSTQTVTIADTAPGAVIYYSTNGSTPSTVYTGPITVATTETLMAYATATNYNQSATASAAYTINLPAAATPTFSVTPGTFTSAQTVAISDATAGAAIYYTLDGSTPTTSSARYTAPITVSSTETINAIAAATGYNNSAVATATYTINLPAAATPTFTPAAGTYTTYQTVTIADATTGATIYYTLDGSTPTTASTKYTGTISVTATETINAIATATGYNTSAVGSAKYTINLAPAATPTFSPAAGTYTSIQTVTIADTTTGATIYYTLDGSTPTTASQTYSGPITVSATETINAIATATGYATSAVGTAAYTINLPAAATPTFSPAGGSYASAQTVTISDTTAGATIYYTVDGSTPTTSSTKYTAAITVASTETVKAIATATGYTTSAVASATYTLTSPTVAVTLSNYNGTFLLAPQTAVQFGTSAASTTQLLIDENQQFQTVEGFGASFTDASAYDLEVVESSSLLPGTLNDLFTRTGTSTGIGLSWMRNPIGASDMARSIYTFDDIPASSTDPTFANFSIAHDQAYIIPLIKSAKALNPSMKLMASPWSPPAWMKTNDAGVPGTGSIGGGILNPADYGYLATYFVKYLQAYAAAGVTTDYLSVQNEPLNEQTSFPTMSMPETTQLPVIRDNVLPQLATAGLSTKVLLYDHNWDTPSYPASLLADPVLLASPVIAGTAWHGYSGPEGAELGVQNQYPTKGQWETEHSGGTFVGSSATQFISDFNEITLVMRSASKSYVKWNLALDQNNGPYINGGCGTCTALIQVNSNTGVPTKTIEFYSLGQFSKFILPGAIRVWSSNTPTIVGSAYINPDGTRVLVAFNNSFGSSTFQVQWGSQNFSYTLAAYAAATFVWNGTQTGTVTQSATQQIQGDSFTTATGLEVEETTDSTGSYDLGYVVDGATAYYKNVNFGTGVSQVNVRVASGGNGGTVEFHLDSATGTLLGTVALPNTGGYQTWQTLNKAITSASGVHDLYMVIHGSGGIGNVNWFQFQ